MLIRRTYYPKMPWRIQGPQTHSVCCWGSPVPPAVRLDLLESKSVPVRIRWVPKHSMYAICAYIEVVPGGSIDRQSGLAVPCVMCPMNCPKSRMVRKHAPLAPNSGRPGFKKKKHHVGPKPEACVWRDLGEGELLFCLEIILVNQPPSLLDNP